jgi:hypothetical protein
MPLTTRTARCATRHIWLAVGLASITPGAAQAQNRAQVIPSFGMTQQYDSNVLSTAADPEADFITRASLGIEVRYRAPLWTMSTRYLNDIERFADHPELSSLDARQRTEVALVWRPSPRTAWTGGVEFWKTETPGELNEASGLVLSRASAQRVSGHSLISRRFSQVTTGVIDYTATEDRIAGGAGATTHDAAAGIEHHWSSRGVVRIDYRFRQYIFTPTGTAPVFGAASHAMTLGWSRAMTARLRVAIDAGPRETNGSAAAEILASLHYQRAPGELSLVYTRTQATVIGLAGAADIQSFSTTMAWPIGSAIRMRLGPALFHSTSADARADAYTLALDVTRPIARDVSIDVSANASLQHGSLGTAMANSTIGRQVVLIRIVAGSSSLLR